MEIERKWMVQGWPQGLSLLENLARCGVPVPEKIRKMLEKNQQDEGQG